ncbi:MAG: hypothetical protein M0P12_06430 [Paludibacteraceae bacterium]|nr:hypothetical protein [Paludibacteraceae bacterium]
MTYKKILIFSMSFCFMLGQLLYAGNPYQDHADELFLSGNLENAFRIYGDAIKADIPEDMNYQLYLNAGDCAFKLNFKQIALNYYGIAAQKGANINTLMKHINIVFCQKETGCTCDALKYIIDKYPDTTDSLSVAIADIFFDKSRHEEAMPIYKRIINKDPKNYKIKKKLAESLLYMDKSDSAKILFQEIDADGIEDYDTYVFLGNYYYLLAAKYQLLLLNNDEAASKQPCNSPNLVDCNKYYKKAAFYLEKAYTLYNSNEIKETLLKIYTQTNNKDKNSKLK